MSSFESTLDRLFPGAIPSADYLAGVRHSVEAVGFTTDNTLPLVSICRDELASRFSRDIKADWGVVFTLAGLGGVPALGSSGWASALSHIPDAHGRGAALVFGLPHIGIEEDGTIGQTLRHDQLTPTPTCGALVNIEHMIQNGTLPTDVDVDDYELTKLALRLVDPLHPPGSLFELTLGALDALESDLWSALDGSQVWRHHDLAVFCGVQVQGRDQDWIWPRSARYVLADGERRRIPDVGIA